MSWWPWRRRAPAMIDPADLSTITGATLVTIECLNRDSCERQFAALAAENARLRGILATFTPK